MDISIACTCDCSSLSPALFELLENHLNVHEGVEVGWLSYGAGSSFAQEPLDTFPL